MSSPDRAAEAQSLTVTPSSETAVFIRQTSVPAESGCLKCGKRTAGTCRRTVYSQGREPKSWTSKLCKFIRADYKSVLLGVGGTLSIAIGIILIVRNYLPSSSHSNADATQVGVPILLGALGSNSTTTRATPILKFAQIPNSPMSPNTPAPHPQEVEPAAVMVYTLNDLNNLSPSAKSVVIKSLSLTGRQTKYGQRGVPVIRTKPNVLTLEIDAGDINRKLLVDILNKFNRVQTLSLNVDKLCIDDKSEEQTQPTTLENVRSFRIIHAHRCKSTLQWILSWNIGHIRRLVMCDTDFTESSTFETLRQFVNGTRSEIEEMVVQETDFCAGCTFQLEFDKLGEIADVTVEKESGQDHEDVPCVY